MSNLVERLAVEYRLFTQRYGKAPDWLLVNSQDADRAGRHVFEEFKEEVAPNIVFQFSRYVEEGQMFFMVAPARFVSNLQHGDLETAWRRMEGG